MQQCLLGYLASKLVTSSLSVLVYLAMIGVPGAFIVGGLQLANISWATLAWVLALGMIGTQLLGATLGAVVPSPRSVGYVSLPLLGLGGGLRHLLPDYCHARLAPGDRSGLPGVLARPRDALRAAAGGRGQRRNRRVVAFSPDGRRPRRLGARRPDHRTIGAETDGPTRVWITRRRATPTSAAQGQMTTSRHDDHAARISIQISDRESRLAEASPRQHPQAGSARSRRAGRPRWGPAARSAVTGSRRRPPGDVGVERGRAVDGDEHDGHDRCGGCAAGPGRSRTIKRCGLLVGSPPGAPAAARG
jgi:hypothetical protein